MRKYVKLAEAAKALKGGSALILDTDTVAGIAVSAACPDALRLLYDAKSREQDKPIAWLVPAISSLAEYSEDVPEYAHKLAEAFWPGALTLIVKASPSIDRALIANDGTIGLRMPDNEACLSLMEATHGALITTSANFSGAPAPIKTEGVDKNFAPEVSVLKPSKHPSEQANFAFSQPSTVVDCTGLEPCLKRAGAIPFSDITKVLDLNIGENKCE